MLLIMLFIALLKLHFTGELSFKLVPRTARAAPEAIVKASLKLNSQGIHIGAFIVVMLVA